ncbi:MAG: hypothetical protein Q4C70_15210, partial [Planctomycetia bacterium]|nr:hypothetical protein [Planctomycetia bacterium]
MKKSSVSTCMEYMVCGIRQGGLAVWGIFIFSFSFGMGLGGKFLSISEVSATEFSRALEARVGLSWNEVPLRDALDRFGTQTDIPIWLDRRVDINFPVSGTFQNATPIQVLRETLV